MTDSGSPVERWTDEDQERERINVLVQAGREVCDLRAALAAKNAEIKGLRAFVAEVEASLPSIFDGMHLADCPYVDAAIRLRAACSENRHHEH